MATHFRSWEKKQRVELPAHREQLRHLKNRIYQDRLIRVFLSLGPVAVDYLKRLSEARQPIRKTVVRLLKLRDMHGEKPLVAAMEQALSRKLFGAEYIENIVYQEMAPKAASDPVCLKNADLNRICLETPCLADYDAYAVDQRGKHDRKHDPKI